MTKKVRTSLIVFGSLSLLIAIGIKLLLSDIDEAIIQYGSQTVRFLTTLSNGLLVVVVLVVAMVIFLQLKQRRQTQTAIKEKTVAKQTNPHFEEQDLLTRLDHLDDPQHLYQEDIALAKQMIKQMNDYLSDLQDLRSTNEYEILDKIKFSMNQAKTQLLQNTKSIINRITVEGDRKEIEKRLTTNKQILQQVKGLLNETVNYLDSKSPSTKADLDNMTKALQSLNMTIE